MGRGRSARSEITSIRAVMALAAAVLAAQGCTFAGDTETTTGAGGGSGGAGGSTGTATDAGTGADAGSRCVTAGSTITCQSQSASIGAAGAMRTVLYETPLGTPPAAGWPAVIYFQGSLVPGHTAFLASEADPLGMYDLTQTIAALLDRGYAVIAPDALVDGTTFWETNIPPYATAWSGCPDDVFMLALFAAVSGGTFGPLDTGKLYAMGISSGGFMTSRMAVSYPGRFRALADHSGSYATCSDVCVVPTPLPSMHPPTLFLHGDLDVVVPMTAIQPYISALQAEGYETSLVTDPTAGHQWLSEGIQAIPAWFDSHP